VTGIGASPLAAPAFVHFYLLLNEARVNARFLKKVGSKCKRHAYILELRRIFTKCNLWRVLQMLCSSGIFFLWWQQQQEIKYVAKATASTATAGKTGNGRAENCWFPFSKEIN
jgi:hypothetical protein